MHYFIVFEVLNPEGGRGRQVGGDKGLVKFRFLETILMMKTEFLLFETRTEDSSHPVDQFQTPCPQPPSLESFSGIRGDDVIGRTINSSEEPFV